MIPRTLFPVNYEESICHSSSLLGQPSDKIVIIMSLNSLHGILNSNHIINSLHAHKNCYRSLTGPVIALKYIVGSAQYEIVASEQQWFTWKKKIWHKRKCLDTPTPTGPISNCLSAWKLKATSKLTHPTKWWTIAQTLQEYSIIMFIVF